MRSTLLASLLFAASLAAQSRESIEVRVTELEVTVLDRSGHPVEGLTREDFEVRIGKRAAPITNFFAVRQGAIVEESHAGAPREISTPRTSIPTTLVIFFDETSLRQGSRLRAIEALKRYVSANLGSMTTGTLIRYHNQLDVRTRPTEKPGYVLAELDRLAREPSLGATNDRERETMLSEIDAILFGDIKGAGPAAGNIAGESSDTVFYRLIKYAERRMAEVERTLAALETAINLISGFSGRKVLLIVSEGLPQQPAADLFEYWDTAYRNSPNTLWRNDTARLDSVHALRFDRSAQFRRVAATAQRARVAVYAFDAGGLRGYEGSGPQFTATEARVNTTLLQANQRAGLQFVAEETGGRYIANENNVDQVLALMSEQFSSWYSIGVQSTRGDIDVKVRNRPGVRVIASRRRPPRTREEELQQSVRTRLYTRMAENPLQARVEIGEPSRVDGQCVVRVQLDVARPQHLAPDALEVHFVMLNERNDESDVRRVAVPFGSERASHAMMLRMQPQRHVLSMAIANPASGEATFVQQEIDGTSCR